MNARPGDRRQLLANLPPLTKYVAAGLGVVALLVAFSLFWNRGAHVDLRGKILKVRLVPTDEHSAVAIFDFRFDNPADVPFVVSDVKVTVVGSDGAETVSDPVAQPDLDRLLEYNKFAGPRYNPMLVVRDKVKSKESLDRTAAGSFSMEEAKLAARKRFILRIYDVDGAVAEIAER
jgi:hypothetical protein